VLPTRLPGASFEPPPAPDAEAIILARQVEELGEKMAAFAAKAERLCQHEEDEASGVPKRAATIRVPRPRSVSGLGREQPDVRSKGDGNGTKKPKMSRTDVRRNRKRRPRFDRRYCRRRETELGWHSRAKKLCRMERRGRGHAGRRHRDNHGSSRNHCRAA
jgi:hypothetical protein